MNAIRKTATSNFEPRTSNACPVRRHRPEPSASERREQLSFWIFIAAIYGILAYHLVPFWLGF